MSEDQALSLTATLGAMVLVGASLMTRRLPVGRMIKFALVWVAIFGAGYLLLAAFL